MVYRAAQSVLLDRRKRLHAEHILPQARMKAENITTSLRQEKPPRLAEFCISLLAPRNTAQALLGDLQEMFQANVRRLGEQEARRKYWLQVAASARPLLWTWIKRIGLFTAFIDYVRSKFGL
jgi:hypothetical protein